MEVKQQSQKRCYPVATPMYLCDEVLVCALLEFGEGGRVR